ncbi:MAG TPA: hypothetical protein DIT99_19755, partial [Candidatus Latescibacteria bacterium]|nr:hypothetical protein [Candidatus Latescibacterota bacterium]
MGRWAREAFYLMVQLIREDVMSSIPEEQRRQILLEEPERVENIFNAVETITPKRYTCFRACSPIV